MNKDFWSRYKTYNPEKEGYGNKEQWRELFEKIIGELGQIVLEEILEFNPEAYSCQDIKPLNKCRTIGELNTSFRKLILIHHPDRGGEHKKAVETILLYKKLKKKLSGKPEVANV